MCMGMGMDMDGHGHGHEPLEDDPADGEILCHDCIRLYA